MDKTGASIMTAGGAERVIVLFAPVDPPKSVILAPDKY